MPVLFYPSGWIKIVVSIFFLCNMLQPVVSEGVRNGNVRYGVIFAPTNHHMMVVVVVVLPGTE